MKKLSKLKYTLWEYPPYLPDYLPLTAIYTQICRPSWQENVFALFKKIALQEWKSFIYPLPYLKLNGTFGIWNAQTHSNTTNYLINTLTQMLVTDHLPN